MTAEKAEAVSVRQLRDATERLIVRDLVRGERLPGANGVYFNRLKLTPKGQRAAIQHRNEVQEAKKALAEASVEGDKVAKEMKGKA